jgi:prepilin-type N-terminal cleavage/methylation domain-containing protein
MRKAFTLSEVLLALAITGILATLVVPRTMDNINKKMLTSQLKNSYQSIQNLAQEKVAAVPTKNLKDTDWASGAISSNDFDIMYNCSSSKKCWADSYKSLNSTNGPSITQSGARLKNGVAIKYINEPNPSNAPFSATNDKELYFGTFYIDVNGPDKPNILGRDLFVFRITDKGRLGDNYANEKTKEQILSDCKSVTNPGACTTYLELNNWNMDY